MHDTSSISAEELKNVEAANDLLLWLSEGEAALVASRTAEKERKDKDIRAIPLEESQAEASQYTEDDDSVVLDHVTKDILSSVDNMIPSTTSEFNSAECLQQPAAMAGRVELKR